MHAIEKTYDRADRSKMLLEDYLKAVSELNRNMRKWVLLFKILRVVNVEQPAKNKITKHMIMRGEYNPDPNRN